MEKGTSRCNGRRSCQICPLIREGDTFENANDSRTFKIFSGPLHCNTESVVYMLQCSCCNKKYVGSTKKNLGKNLMFINRISGHTHANIPRAVLGQGNQSHKAVFLVIFSTNNTGAIFLLPSKSLIRQRMPFHFVGSSYFGNTNLGLSRLQA